ncbi:uncharacterized protein GGS22DRAFT_125201 [Annulohypoxylon maeteangense]|uniref:uncharacterized protein n=1 Tax=Annulohypoxylon maeteangense TaxID=1927788 RepID=UPI0020086146|nr:uncharacterized protein GGS22DRAFT_125201 [Annulohypoxylon maeteangense]KAI0886170.1 hypothetical protein GGS22DRAFT_125201 [Annulohypoxylon maeteangense]
MEARTTRSFSYPDQFHEKSIINDPDNSTNPQVRDSTADETHSTEDEADYMNNPERPEKYENSNIHTFPLKPIEKLGWIPLMSFCLGPFISFLAVGFLVFLWIHSSAKLWLIIVTAHWTSRSITLCALIIRIVVDLTTGFCASMLAAQILERGSVYLGGLANISIMRAATPSLSSLILSFRQVGSKSKVLSPLILTFFLAILMFALQFSSTILLSDLQVSSVIGLQDTSDYSYDLDWGWNKDSVLARVGGQDIYNSSLGSSTLSSGPGIAYIPSVWTRRPESFPIFAEYREPIPAKPNVDDTGYSFKSFLPFSDSEQRRSIASFRGPSFVLDSRVSCQKPIISALNTTHADTLWYEGNAWYTIAGTVSNSTDVDGLWFPEDVSREIPFACQHRMMSQYYPAPDQNETDDRNIGFEICPIQSNNHYIKLPNELDPETVIVQKTEAAGSLRSQLYNYTVSDQNPSRGPAFLVIASNWTLSQREYETFTKVQVKMDNSSNHNSPIVEDVLFSLCYTSWESAATYTEMNTRSQLKEDATIEYRTDLHNYDFVDISSILYHYGLGSSTPSTSTLSLSKPKFDNSLTYPFQQFCLEKMLTNADFNTLLHGWGAILEKNKANNISTGDYYTGLSADASAPGDYSKLLKAPLFRTWAPILGNETIGFYNARTLPNEMIPERLPDPILQKFFIDAMKLTDNSLASSLSGLLTLLSSLAYYELIPLFRKNGTADVTRFETVTYPQSWRGLTAVVSLLAAHLLVCTVILYTFLTRTQLTRLGSSWSSIAQIYSAGTETIMRDGTLASDGEVEKHLSEKGRARRLVRVSLVADGDSERCEPVFIQGDDDKSCL